MKRIGLIFTIIITAACCLFGCAGNGDDPITAGDGAFALGEAFNMINSCGEEKVKTESAFVIDEDTAESLSDFRPEPIISNNMVLQRNAVTRLFGAAFFEGEFGVTVNGKTFYGLAQGGRFIVHLAPMEAGGPYDIVLYGPGGKFTISNVLIGEVILFSGQSNMMWEMNDTVRLGKQDLRQENLPDHLITYLPDKDADPVTYNEFYATDELKQQFVDIAQAEIEEYENIRLCLVNSGYDEGYISLNDEERQSVSCEWTSASYERILKSSMFAYYFSKNLHNDIEIPVGVVVSSWGGTFVSAWTPREIVDSNPEVFKYIGGTSTNSKARCFNSFIAPILDFRVKAVVWYQGEGQTDNYAQSVALMMETWRERMDNYGLGVLIVQIPRYAIGGALPQGVTAEEYRRADVYTGIANELYFGVREQQKLIPGLIDNCAMSVSVDQGDYDDIHPSDKRGIAKVAEKKFVEYFYGASGMLSGPEIKTAERLGDDILITFDNIGSGLSLRNGGVNFEVSEDGQTFFEVRARLHSPSQILVPKGDLEIGAVNFVRYGALDYPRVSRTDMTKYMSLYNSGGFPCDQFVIKV